MSTECFYLPFFYFFFKSCVVLQFAFNSWWKVLITGQTGSQLVVNVLCLPKVSITAKEILMIIKSCDVFPFFFFDNFRLFEFTMSRNIFTLQKIDISSLFSQCLKDYPTHPFIHPRIHVHMMLSIGRIDMCMIPKKFVPKICIWSDTHECCKGKSCRILQSQFFWRNSQLKFGFRNTHNSLVSCSL